MTNKNDIKIVDEDETKEEDKLGESEGIKIYDGRRSFEKGSKRESEKYDLKIDTAVTSIKPSD